jgi:circadian clock protein KaiC
MRESRISEKLEKSPTGIAGLDEITLGGLPLGRTALVCGGPGCGKTVLAMEYLVRGATEFGEPGVFLAFEENSNELTQNFQAMGFDLPKLCQEKKLAIDYIYIEKSEIEETGDFDLEGLFVRLEHAIDSIGAKRVVLDTIEMLFSGFPNPSLIRAEIRRLFRWLKDKGVTAIVTGEKGEGTLTRYGLEEYVADCVLFLDHRIEQQVSTRRMRIVKYRGSAHGSNEYPFLIGEAGISILPITSAKLDHKVSPERVSTGVVEFDEMLGGKGFYRGSSILISGTAGTGKSTLACHAVEAASKKGERCAIFAFEESPDQLMRNMLSGGIDLRPHVERGNLSIHSSRPTIFGLELHLVMMHQMIQKIKPDLIVVDPISDFTPAGTHEEIKSMLTRLIDYVKSENITGIFTSLTCGGDSMDASEQRVSSLMDTWILLRDIERNEICHRGLRILKSRGMKHSNQIREFFITDGGVKILPGKGNVPTGEGKFSADHCGQNTP